MTKATARWVGGLAAVALGSMLALGGCADRMMKDDKGMMDKK